MTKIFSFKKFILIFFIIMDSILNAFAQKELYFSDKPHDSVSISGMQGLHIGADMDMYFNNIMDINSYNIYYPISIGYFNELKLGPTTSLIFSGNLIGRKSIESYTNIFDENGMVIGQNRTYTLGLSFDIEAEPRWYFNFRNQYVNGKNTKLNSGLFMGLPVSVYTSPMIKIYPLQVSCMFSPSFGYRYAISNKFFIEAGASYRFNLLTFNYLTTNPFLSLKVAYIFK